MRRTMTFTLEVDGASPDAEQVRNRLLGLHKDYQTPWTVAHVHIVDDGIARRSDQVSK